MLSIVISMCLVLAISAVVVVYVAFPHRGEDLPAVPWLGEAMRRGADALPTLEDDEHHGNNKNSGHNEHAESRSIFQHR